jgi:aspartyl-tRNA(Asn)/glutamyl-tRNA(Gln) amidotransferase subunit B
MNYTPTIGLEIHVQLATKSKMFCGCAVEPEALPNQNLCPVCLGMPGVLPVINRQALEWAFLAALALECRINKRTKFDRKNYFYPDLPKGYQISQYDLPIGEHGRFVIDLPAAEKGAKSQEKEIRIKRLHLEEDAGKLVHPQGENYSLVDLNRCGTPLLEIVTEPDISSPAEARLFLQELRKLMRYLGISEANMELGQLRCDANVSVSEGKKPGIKVEIKNMNSFKFVEQALAFEIKRQSALLFKKEKIVQETRGFDERSGETFSQRIKEEAEDYRYFPEPDLPPICVVDGEPRVTQTSASDASASGEKQCINISDIRAQLPELPRVKKKRFMADWGLSLGDAETLTNDKDLAKYYEETVAVLGKEKAQKAANWVLSVMLEQLNKNWVDVAETKVKPSQLADLIKLIEEGKLNNRMAKEIFEEMFTSGEDASVIIERKGMGQISDEEELEKIIGKIILENPSQVEQYKAGNEKIFGFLIGQVMKETQGRANPEVVNKLLKNKLKN